MRVPVNPAGAHCGKYMEDAVNSIQCINDNLYSHLKCLLWTKSSIGLLISVQFEVCNLTVAEKFMQAPNTKRRCGGINA